MTGFHIVYNNLKGYRTVMFARCLERPRVEPDYRNRVRKAACSPRAEERDDNKKRSWVDMTSQSITCYDSLKQLKLTPPVEVVTPKTHLIALAFKEYRMFGKLIPYNDPLSGVTHPLDSWMEIVPAMNQFLRKCVNGKSIKIFHSEDTGRPGTIPDGLHLFTLPCEITERLILDALDDAKNLYWNPKHRAYKGIHMKVSAQTRL